MSTGPRTGSTNPLAQVTIAGLVLTTAVEPTWPAAGAKGPAIAIERSHAAHHSDKIINLMSRSS
jgi:hypothetical protein